MTINSTYRTNNFSKKPIEKKKGPEKPWKTFDVDIEIVDFFPNKLQKNEDILRGTMHVYLIHYDIDIKGINVFIDKKNEKYSFYLPSQIGWDSDTEKNVRYPTINFVNVEKQRKLVSNIIRHGTVFMKKYIKLNQY